MFSSQPRRSGTNKPRKSTIKYRALPPDVRLTKMAIVTFARASFRKSGPGVRRQLRAALGSMSQAHRLIAAQKGWDQGLLYLNSKEKLVVA